MAMKRNQPQNTDFIEFVEGRLDTLIEGDYPQTNIDIASACDSFRPDKDTMKYVNLMYANLYEEVSSTQKDFAEAWEHLSKRQRNNLLNFVGQVMTINAYVPKETEKVTRFHKPRRKKEKTPAQLTAKMVCVDKDHDLELTAAPTRKIINSNGCVFYNIKTRKIMLFVARKGLKLSVKGSKILNFDVEISGIKNLRKPGPMLKPYLTLTIAKAKKAFNAIVAKSGKMTGSINKQCLLFRVF